MKEGWDSNTLVFTNAILESKSLELKSQQLDSGSSMVVSLSKVTFELTPLLPLDDIAMGAVVEDSDAFGDVVNEW